MSKSPKVLVLGATGMLGRIVFLYLKSKKIVVTGTSRKRNEKFIKFIFGKTPLDLLFKKKQYDYVVNCIGALRGSTQKKQELLNAKLPKQILNLSQKYSFRIINISTDAVFSDDSRKINEDSKPNPQDSYGRTKLKGETKKNTINIRLSILGFDPSEHKGLLEYVINHKSKQALGFVNQVWSGATTLDLAKFIAWIISRRKFDHLREISHVFHFVPLGPFKKYEILLTFSKIIKLNNVRKDYESRISRRLETKYFDELAMKKYTSNLKKALLELIKFDKRYVKEITKN